MYQYPSPPQQPFNSVGSSPYGAPPAPPSSASGDMNMPNQNNQQPNSYSHGGMPSNGHYAEGGMMASNPHFSHGGMSGKHKSGSMIDAHFNGHELDFLDHLQGKKMVDRRSGERIYPHLEELFKNPHIRDNIHHHFKEHLASGGHVHDQEMARHLHSLAMDGRHGDREMAKIGPHTHHLLNYMAGGMTQNPHDGKPEYWSLSGMLGSAGNALKGAASKGLGMLKSGAQNAWNASKPVLANTARTMLPMGAQMLAQKLGAGDVGSQLAGMGAGALIGGVLGPEQTNLSPTQMAAQKGMMTGVGHLMSGKSLGQSFGHGLREGASDSADSPVGQGLMQMGDQMSQGRGLGESMKSGASHGYQSMGGDSALPGIASHILSGAGQEGGMAGRAREIGGAMMPNQQAMNNRQMQQQGLTYDDL